jgi:hypothetical protein
MAEVDCVTVVRPDDASIEHSGREAEHQRQHTADDFEFGHRSPCDLLGREQLIHGEVLSTIKLSGKQSRFVGIAGLDAV